MKCKRCGARGDAHFGWCVSVGGPGYPPSKAPKVVDTALPPEDVLTLAKGLQPALAAAPDLAPPKRGKLMVLHSPVHVIEPGVRVVSTRTPQENAERLRRNELLWTAVSGDVDWGRFDIEATAHQLFESCQRGLPWAIAFGYHPDVLALQGLDLPQCEAAVRAPERVEIRPETGKKGYPILGFSRGDVKVILGMRAPTRPMVIAAYWTSLLAADEHRRPERVGGGGARKPGGLPTTVTALVKRLTEAGADVDEAWKTSGTAAVKYHGQELGKVTTGPGADKRQVQQDWQRTTRKMHAIDQREAASA